MCLNVCYKKNKRRFFLFLFICAVAGSLLGLLHVPYLTFSSSCWEWQRLSARSHSVNIIQCQCFGGTLSSSHILPQWMQDSGPELCRQTQVAAIIARTLRNYHLGSQFCPCCFFFFFFFVFFFSSSCSCSGFLPPPTPPPNPSLIPPDSWQHGEGRTCTFGMILTMVRFKCTFPRSCSWGFI